MYAASFPGRKSRTRQRRHGRLLEFAKKLAAERSEGPGSSGITYYFGDHLAHITLFVLYLIENRDRIFVVRRARFVGIKARCSKAADGFITTRLPYIQHPPAGSSSGKHRYIFTGRKRARGIHKTLVVRMLQTGSLMPCGVVFLFRCGAFAEEDIFLLDDYHHQ